MDDMTAFERQVRGAMVRSGGPVKPVDDLAIFTAVTTSAKSPKWAIRPTFSTTKFAVTGVIVALLGGVLLIAQPFDQQGSVPGAATGDAGTFSPTGSLAWPRSRHTATLLPDGRVLVVGGHAVGDQPTSTAEVWDPAPVPSARPARSTRPAQTTPPCSCPTAASSSSVVVVWASADDLEAAEIWDPATGSFSPAGSPVHASLRRHTSPPFYPTAASSSSAGEDRAVAEVWDPGMDTLSPAGSAAYCSFPTAASSSPVALNPRRLEIFGTRPPLRSARQAHSSYSAPITPQRLLADGRVLIMEDPTEDWVAARLGMWSGTRSRIRSARQGSSAMDMDPTWPPRSCPTVASSSSASPTHATKCRSFLHASAEVWDPATSTFSPAGSLRWTRWAPRDDFPTTTAPARRPRPHRRAGCYPTNLAKGSSPRGEVWDPDTAVLQSGRLALRGHAGPTPPRSCPTAASSWSAAGKTTGLRVHASAEVWEPSDP